MKKVLYLIALIVILGTVVFASDMEYIFERQVGGNEGKLPSEFDYPVCITSDTYGNIYVTDWNNSRVQKFSSEGKFLLEIGNQSSPKLKKPIGIDIDNDNNIYVVDYGNNRVIKYDENGNLILTFGKFGSKDGEFRSPRGIFVDRLKDEVIVADYSNYRIQIFDLDGKFKKAIKCYDPSTKKNYNPRSAARDKSGFTYIVFTRENNIWKINENGEIVLKFGGEGSEPGQFKSPRYINTDNLDNIYVTDYSNNRVQIFTTDGKCRGYFGEKGNEPGKFNNPEGIFVNRKADLYIVDSENNRFQIFRAPEITHLKSLAAWYKTSNDQEELENVYKKIFDIEPDNTEAKKYVLASLVRELENANEDEEIRAAAQKVLTMDNTQEDALKALEQLKEKQIRLEKKKKVRLIIVLVILLIVIIILIMVLKPQKKQKRKDENNKIIMW